MYFVLSKVLWFLAGPSNLLVLLAAAGAVLLFTPRWRAGRAIVAVAAAGLVAAGFLPVANLLLAPLEDRFPACREDAPGLDTVIVLGGPAEPRPTAARGQLVLNDAAERLVAMADLARRHPDWRIVFTGGSGGLTEQAFSEADAIERHQGTLGLAPGRVVFERASRNTVENARFVADMLRPRPGQRVLLVTSAHHMPRSVGLFRAAGFDVVACPVDYRTVGGDTLSMFAIAGDGLRRTDVAVREYVGLLAARLLGQSQELFPAP